MNKIKTRIDVLLLILLSIYSVDLQGGELAGLSGQFAAIDSLSMEDNALAETLQLSLFKRDSVINARKSSMAARTFAMPQLATFGAAASIPNLSRENLLMYLKLDHNGDDASGNGNDGQPGGNHSFVSEAHFGSSIHCIGSGYVNANGGHVSLPDLGLNNLTEFTISIWVKDEATTPDEGLIWFGDWHTGWGGIAHLWGSTLFHVGGVGTAGGGIHMPFESDDLGVWVMYTLVYDNEIMKVYKNGRYLDQIAVDVYIPKGQFSGLGRHWWGGNGEGNSSRYTGKIDEARVYQVALSDAEVFELYGFSDPDGGTGDDQIITSLDKNYVLEYAFRAEGINEEEDFSALDPSRRMANITYYDGLGRAEQQTAIQAGSEAINDIIVPIQYDEFGRQSTQYLPYSASANGLFQENAIDREYTTNTDHYQFYTDATNGVVDDTKPFSKSIFEVSPLNRVVKQGAPGEEWQPDEDVAVDDHSVKMEYSTNAEDEVFLWTIKDGKCVLDQNTYYELNKLYVSITKNENWHSNQIFENAATVREYKDKLGRVVLKRTYNYNEDNQSQPIEEVLDTYYVYDDFGNLRFVIPPAASANLTGESWADISESNVFTTDATLDDQTPGVYFYSPGVTVTFSAGTFGQGFEVKPYPVSKLLLDEYLFTYKYDDRQRMIEKKVPGADPVYMVYDKRDRLVLTQDGEQRKNDTWLFTKYDVLNRPILTGKKLISGNQAEVQALVNEFYANDPDDPTKYYEERLGLSTGDDQGYSDRSFPEGLADADYLTSTYYDDYDFIADDELTFTSEPVAPYDQNEQLVRPRGQATGGKVKNLQDGSWLEHASYYDRKYRVIYSVSQNHVGGWDKTLSYYSFIGDLKNERYQHTASGQNELIINKAFNYDHASRLLSVDYQVGDSGTPVTLLTNEYNEIGELVTKYLHGDDMTYKQKVDYSYNIRGWLTGINDPTNVSLEGDYFGMNLKYNDPQFTAALNSESQYNGNISEIHWQNAQTETLSGYGFNYDDLNRLRTSHFGSGATFAFSDGHWDENMNYDLNGNILSLMRKAAGLDVDDLEYGYTGNQLNYVDDGITDYTGEENHFVDGDPGTETDYMYDANGNMISDANKGIQNISYNYLNLPGLIDFGNGKSITYIYDATGTKLKKVVKDPGKPDKATDYVGGMIYEDNVRKFMNTEEGRIILDHANPEYQYHMKDHLGNVRLTFTTEREASTYLATMESEVSSQEEATFDHISTTQHQDVIYNHTAGGNTSSRLNGVEGKVMGPAMSLHLMKGDTVNMTVFAKYTQASSSADPVTGMTAIIAASAGIGSVTEASQLSTGLSDVFGAGQVAAFDSNNTIPKAYINYLFFDMDKRYQSGGFRQVSATALNSFEELNLSFFPDKEGYIMIYVANQTNEDLDVYFDDMTVEHIEGPIIQTDDYYPFGLTFNSSERSGFTTNKFLYNGKELQTDLNLDTYAYEFRHYDPTLARWHVMDPLTEKYFSHSSYSYAMNNPINLIDFLGLEPDDPDDDEEDKNDGAENQQVFSSDMSIAEVEKWGKENGIDVSEITVGEVLEKMEGLPGEVSPYLSLLGEGMIAIGDYRSNSLYKQAYRLGTDGNYLLKGRNLSLFGDMPMTNASKPFTTLGSWGKGLSNFGTGLTVASSLIDTYQYSKGEISGARYSYRLVGNGTVLYALYAVGGGYAAAAGLLYYGGELTYDHAIKPAIDYAAYEITRMESSITGLKWYPGKY